MTTAATARLHPLLDAGQAWAAHYGGRMSNHLPMAQQALAEMGASAQRLQAFTDVHQAKLAPRGAGRPPGIAGERDLGRPGSDAAWRAHFGARIDQLGTPAALREALALLLPGAGAMAFHGLIRTGHAMLAGHPVELAAGLAHWAEQFLPLPFTEGDALLMMPDWLQALQQLPRPACPAGSFIADRMAAWGAAPGFADVAGQLHLGSDSLRDIAMLAARTYAVTGNFTVLHLLTASHALSVLQPWWPAINLPRSFSVAAAAGLLASGVAPVATLDREPRRPWQALLQAACAQDDAHVIKLTHAAWRLDRLWPDTVWRCAAERGLRY